MPSNLLHFLAAPEVLLSFRATNDLLCFKSFTSPFLGNRFSFSSVISAATEFIVYYRKIMEFSLFKLTESSRSFTVSSFESF